MLICIHKLGSQVQHILPEPSYSANTDERVNIRAHKRRDRIRKRKMEALSRVEFFFNQRNGGDAIRDMSLMRTSILESPGARQERITKEIEELSTQLHGILDTITVEKDSCTLLQVDLLGLGCQFSKHD